MDMWSVLMRKRQVVSRPTILMINSRKGEDNVEERLKWALAIMNSKFDIGCFGEFFNNFMAGYEILFEQLDDVDSKLDDSSEVTKEYTNFKDHEAKVCNAMLEATGLKDLKLAEEKITNAAANTLKQLEQVINKNRWILILLVLLLVVSVLIRLSIAS